MLDQILLESIAAEVEAGELPPDAGVAVAVVAHGLTHRSCVGLRERDSGLPVTERTVFELCSLTKTFTAAGLMRAAETGLLDLDHPINASAELLTFASEQLTRETTVADILSHRTGVSAGDLLWYFGSVERGRACRAVPSLPVIDGGFRRTFLYNNMLYGALGELYPDLAGSRWDAWITAQFLEPLGMSSTTFGASSDGANSDGGRALPYVGTRRVRGADAAAVAAAGGMRSTLQDMARWLAFWVDSGRASDGSIVLGERSVARAFEPAVAFGDASPVLLNGLDWASSELHYGLGWFVGRYADRRIAFHPGFIDGYTNVIAVMPDAGVGAIVLSNVNFCGAIGRLVRTLLDSLQSTPGPTPDPWSHRAGRYRHESYGDLTVAQRGSRWSIQYRGQRWPLSWKDDGTAQVIATVFGLSIPLPLAFRDASGTPVLDIPLAMDPRVGPQTFARVTPVRP